MMSERTRSMAFWLIGVSLLMVLMIAFYPSVRDSGDAFNEYMESLPEGLQEAFGLAGESMTSPEGYLVSQLYSNMYPIVVMILAFGLAAWSVAGSEADGTLELTLANPVSRRRVALERVGGTLVLSALLTVVSTLVLVAVSPVVGLDDGLAWWALWSAGLQMLAFVMVLATLVFAVGAATGSKGLAIAVGSAVAVVGFLVQALAPIAEVMEDLRWGSPWFWMLRDNPVTTPPNWLNTLLPFGLAALFVAVGTWAFDRRDLKF
jgi:ABC-2 type transport system permease protein